MKKRFKLDDLILDKLLSCFIDEQETAEFLLSLEHFSTETALIFNSVRISDDGFSRDLITKQLCYFTLFCREHLEIIHSLISKVDLEEIK